MVAVLQPVNDGKLIIIDRAVVLVGRSSDCDAIISASQKISRRHCCLVQVDDQYYVRDLGSMNGVWLNGERVIRECRMSSGDRLSIGDVEFLFHPNVKIESKKNAAAAQANVAPDPSDEPTLAPQAKPSPPRPRRRNTGSMDDVIPLGDAFSPAPTPPPGAPGQPDDDLIVDVDFGDSEDSGDDDLILFDDE
ncbi:MAG: FHA domain-containing protein [Planctomycetaceae bacterium]|nr:FHA domain-containing protein [Planctomycetaceae bacterium]